MKSLTRLIAIFTLALAMVGVAAGQGNVLLQSTADVSNIVGAGKQTTVQFFNQVGSANIMLEFKFSGAPATTSIPILGCGRGGTCNTIATIATGVNQLYFIGNVYDYVQMTPVFTGGTNPFVTINYTSISQSSGGGSGIGSTNIQGPVPANTSGAGVNPIPMGAFQTPGGLVQDFICGNGGGTQCGFWGGPGTAVDGVSNGNIGFPYNSGNGGSVVGGLVVAPNLFNGTTWDRIRYCGTVAPAVINPSTATTTLLIAATAAKTNRVCGIEITGTAAQTVKIIVGTQTTTPCDTGVVTVSPTYQLAANSNLYIGNNVMTLFQGTTTNQQVCAVTSAAVSTFVAAHFEVD